MPFIKKEFWWIRGFDFPHVQFTVLGIVCVIFGMLLSSPFPYTHTAILLQVVLGLIYKLKIIYPFTALHSLAVPKVGTKTKTKTVSILASNVYMENKNYEGFLDRVKDVDPEIVFMLETNAEWMKNVHPYLEQHYPFQILHPLENTYGLLFYSKVRLENEQIRFLVEDDVPSISTVLCLEGGRQIMFLGLHPKPPSPTENSRSTPRDAELIIAGMEARASSLPVIIAGDMNDVAWSHTTRLFTRISGLLDLRIGRGFFNTFHAKYPLLRWPLDHIFVSHHFKVVSMKRLKNFNSDHFPIYAKLALESSLEAADNVEYPDISDLKEANQKVIAVE